jgi:serine/threonine-protein kinase
VGSWRIVDLFGRGAYGTLYLAESVAPGTTRQAALKLALAPRDERFERERVLLSRLRHPCIPRLLDSGTWQSPGGPPHPYLVMEWIEGLPLYEWAQVLPPTSRQVLGLLADLARALEATHAMGAVHRDVKGGNALVRLPDGQGFLVDFGSGSYQGASRLTWQPLPPGTPDYRSPEAFRFAAHGDLAPTHSYAPGPADDLFALGVTAYRLVTGDYPPLAEPVGERAHVWAEEDPGPQPARELNARCSAELSALISRMLSVHPKARGSAREVAEALEQAARQSGPEADEPLFPGKAPWPLKAEAVPWPIASMREEAEAAPRHSRPPARLARWRPWLVAGALTLGAAWILSTSVQEGPSRGRVAAQVEAADAGTVALGDSAQTTPVASARVSSTVSPIALDLPSKPFPRQIRTDANGRCPRKRHVPINGGCWWTVEGAPEDCREDNYVYKGKCYEPAYPPQPPATSAPGESPDGGR